MKRVLLAAGMALALSAAPMAAQTRVSVVVGFGVPRPYVTGVVILGRPPVYYPHRRAFYYLPPLFVARRDYVGPQLLLDHLRHFSYEPDLDRDHHSCVTAAGSHDGTAAR